jgi:hypothetical protein
MGPRYQEPLFGRIAMNRCSECGGQLTPDSNDHVQVAVTSEYGPHAHVDEGIAALIQICWDIGIDTAGSCQGDPETGLASIVFSPGHAERFVGAATFEDLENAPDDALGVRMRGCDDPGSWQWQPHGFAWTVNFGAGFPPSDIPELVRRLEWWR